MPGQALASNNPARESSVIWKREDFLELTLQLDLHERERVAFFDWVCACTDKKPRGSRIVLCRSIKTGALALGICPNTMRKRIRRWEALGLVHRENESWLRTNQHVVNQQRLRHQDWPDGICPRCNHKHLGRQGAECGCKTGERVWRREGHRERLVERTCRCVPREIAPPILPKRRKGPQSVPKASPAAAPEASPAVERAATPPLPPPAAAPRQEPQHRSFQSSSDPSAERTKISARQGGKLIGKMHELVKGVTRWEDPQGGMGRELHPGDRGYRAPISKSKALYEACFFLGIPYWSGKEYAERCGWKFEEPQEE